MLTYRNLIQKVVGHTEDLDKEVPLWILHRDDDNVVVKVQVAGVWTMINGKIYVEAGSLQERAPR